MAALLLLVNGAVFWLIVSYLNDPRAGIGAPFELFFGQTVFFWLVLLFVAPVVTMRLLSEERRSGTIEVLMTAPVTEAKVVVGKYLAALIFYLFLWLPTVVYAVILSRYSEVDWGPVASGYVGVAGIGALLLAAGVLASALSRSQLLAAVLTFAIAGPLFAIGFLEFLFTGEVLEGDLHVSEPAPPHGGLQPRHRRQPPPGLLRVGVGAVPVSRGARAGRQEVEVEMEIGDTSRARLQRSSGLWAGVILVILLVGIVNYFGWKYHERFDWTASRLYTLSEKSESVLGTLDREVEAIVLMDTGDDLYDPVTELLARYDAASPRFTVRLVDAQKNLMEAQQLVDRFELSRLGVVILDSDSGRRVVDAADLAEYDYSGMQMGQAPQMLGFKGESAFTSALLDMMESRKPKILFTVGHGELELDDFSPRGMSALRDLLGKDNFDMEEWRLLGQGAVPKEADLIVIAGPTSTFVEPEVALLRSHLESGGRLLVMMDPTLADSGLVQTGLEGLLADFGATVGDNIVVDPANPLPFFGAETIFIGSYGDHVITRPLDQAQLPVIVPLGRSVSALLTPGLEIVELLRTSGEGWGETDLVNLDRVELGDADLAGPVALGVAVELSPQEADAAQDPAEPAEGEGSEPAGPTDQAEPSADGPDAAAEEQGMRLVVIGDSDLASNGQMQNAPNATFIANAMNWLVERENLVTIPSKKPEQVRLSLTGGQLRGVTWTVLVLLPGLALAMGVFVYRKRRR